MHDDRRAVHRVRLRRQAGARQHPLGRPRGRVRGVSPRRRGRPPSTTSAAAARATARCSRRSRCASRSPAASSTGRCRDDNRIGDHRWWISDLAAVPRRLSRLGASPTTSRACCARSTTTTWSCGQTARVKLSVVIPAHNEVDSIGQTVRARPRRARARARSTTRSLVVDDASGDGTGDVVRAIAAQRSARPLRPLTLAARLRSRGPRRSRRVHRRRGGDHDGRPVGLAAGPRRSTTACSSSGYDCAFGTRFGTAARPSRLPARQARAEPDRQRRHPGPVPARLQRHHQRVQGLPARGDRPDPAAALESLQPHRRDAAQGDRARLSPTRSCRSRGRNRTSRRIEARVCRRWAAATCSSSSTCCSSTTSAAAIIAGRTSVTAAQAGLAGSTSSSRKP